MYIFFDNYRVILFDCLLFYYGNFWSILLGWRLIYDVDEIFLIVDDSYLSMFKEKEIVVEGK